MGFRRSGICLLLALSSLLVLAPHSAQALPSWISIGPEGGQVQTLATTPARPGWVFAGLVGSGFGVFRSINRGRDWSPAPGEMGRQVYDLAINSDARILYAATADGLLRSTDSGTVWLPLDASQPYTLVVAHPRRAGIVYAVRGGSVLYRSTDGGAVRQAVTGPEQVQTVAFSSGSLPLTTYAGANNGLWKSTDDGRTWTLVNMGPAGAAPPVQSLVVDPRNPQILYAGVRLNQRVLFKSVNGGATWRLSQRGISLTNGLVPIVIDLAVDPADSSVVYAVVGGDLYRSLNAGRDWSLLPTDLPGRLIADLETTPYGLLAATRAGVLHSANRGQTWQLRTTGLIATSITGLALDNQQPVRLYAADAAVGIFKTANQGRPWLRLGEIDGFFGWARPVEVDPDDPQVVYTGSAFAVAKSTNGGRRWTLHRSPDCNVVSRIFIDPLKTSRLFATGPFFTGGCGLLPDACLSFRSLDAGETWQCLGGGLPRYAIALGIEPFDSIAYAAFDTGLWSSADGGTTWSLLTDHLAATSFAASPLVEGTLWVGQESAVARSRDGGQTWQSFPVTLTGDRPAGRVLALATDPVHPETLYAAVSQMVFKSTDGGETWDYPSLWPSDVAFQGGLLVDPNDPEILYAGTDGRGVLRLDQSEN